MRRCEAPQDYPQFCDEGYSTVAQVSEPKQYPGGARRTISTANAELRTFQGLFWGHRWRGFWRIPTFQRTYPSGSQRKYRSRGKGSHHHHFLTTRGHYYGYDLR